MSVDYELYLSEDITQEVLRGLEFVEYSKSSDITRGSVFDEKLSFAIVKSGTNNIFTQEEVGFEPRVKLILSPEMGSYDESINAIIKVINACIDRSGMIKFYQNNDVLLLEKIDKKIILHNLETSWWTDYLELLDFDFIEK